jgi:hypothetical protein
VPPAIQPDECFLALIEGEYRCVHADQEHMLGPDEPCDNGW